MKTNKHETTTRRKSLKRNSFGHKRIPPGYRLWYWKRCLQKTRELLANGGGIVPVKPYLDSGESCDFCGKMQITRCFPLEALEGNKKAIAGSECIRTVAKVTKWLKKNGCGAYAGIPKPENIIKRFLLAGKITEDEAETLLQDGPRL